VLHEAMIQTGTFFFSGAFWLLIELLVRGSESQEGLHFTSWMAMCLLSMVFGGLLAFFGWRVVVMRRTKLKNYFPDEA